MSGFISRLQEAVAARLLADATVVGLVADTPDGPAVFAPRQPYSDSFPRVTLQLPQVLRFGGTACTGRECFVTVHSWARGPEATLVAADLADAVHEALMVDLTIPGHAVGAHRFEGTTPVGDPDPTIDHFVSVFRYLATPAA